MKYCFIKYDFSPAQVFIFFIYLFIFYQNLQTYTSEPFSAVNNGIYHH